MEQEQSPFMGHPMHNAAYNVYVNPYGMRRLSPSFRPGRFDVFCARGKIAYGHEGNRRFRALVKQHQKRYSACTSKYQKSKIVSHIVNTVRNASPHGGFVKLINGVYHEVGDRSAKEKVGQTFRDLLHTKYSSSTKAKALARLQRRTTKEEKNDDKAAAETAASSRNDPPSKKVQAAPKIACKSIRKSADEARSSSISVVSDASMERDDDEDNNNNNNRERKMTSAQPPVRNAVVVGGCKKRKKRSLTRTPQEVMPPPEQVSSSTTSTLADTLRRSTQPFDDDNDGYHQTRQLSLPGQQNRQPPSLAPDGELEPLPLEKGSVLQVDFHDSANTLQSEESFEDVMDEFYNTWLSNPAPGQYRQGFRD